MNFWKIIKPLAEEYHVIMIDIIGMGGSSRPHFNLSDPKDIDEYLIEWLEKWRNKMGNIENFVLAGHSFGGYISGLYAIRYPQYIKKLLLLSPLGITRTPPDFDLMREFEKFPPEMRPPKFVLYLAPLIWKYMSSPFDFVRNTGPHM